MRRFTILTTAALALALPACGKKPVKSEPAAPATTAPASTDVNNDVDLVELPAMQADLRAKAGSDTVYFGTDQYAIDEASRGVLAAQARWLLQNSNVRASIEGHADERGTREYNLALGERRANATRDYLIAQGVPANRLTIISWGKERPAAMGSDETAWAQNRRAVTIIVK